MLTTTTTTTTRSRSHELLLDFDALPIARSLNLGRRINKLLKFFTMHSRRTGP
nr:hypothetical protein [uncultured Rhodococcus sp.]